MLSVISISTQHRCLSVDAMRPAPDPRSRVAPQLKWRNVHGNSNGGESGSIPAADVTDRLKQNPLPDIHDGAGALEQGTKATAPQAVLGVLPAQKRLETLDPARCRY